jgi:hypothetical protein
MLQLTLQSDRHVVINQGIANKTGNVRINATLRSVRVTVLALERQLTLYTLSVCYPALAILHAYCRLWPTWLYHIFNTMLCSGMNAKYVS